MANFASIANQLEGIVNNQLPAARSSQGAWEWYNALQRIMSQNRFTGTPRVDGPSLIITSDRDVEANAVQVFGLLLDNAMAAEDAYLALFNTNTPTAGTTDALGYLYVPRASLVTYVFPTPLVFSTALSIKDILGTEAGLEAGTGSTSGVTATVVYTE